MDGHTAVLAAAVLLLTLSRSLCTGAAAIAANAQATSEETANAALNYPETHLLVKRYVPQFVGKRKPDANKVSANTDTGVHATDDDLDDIHNADEAHLLYLLGKYESGLGENPDLDALAEEINEDKTILDSAVDAAEIISNDDNTDLADKRMYQPSFVGKRYQPMFVGKRYIPRFVGKKSRNSPMFVGKKYHPMFVGKKYQPMFVGKRYQPMFVGKRYQPMFVGKRYQPMFVGKRYHPMFVGKKASSPMFVGKRPQYRPMFVGKRSVTETEDNTDTHSRRKRSILMDGPLAEEKRSWGHYVPWQGLSAVDMYQPSPQITASKRFVPPEFIGRRDSMDNILSALKAFRIARNQPRFASKRFQAPLFIGKRSNADELADGPLLEQSYGFHFPGRL